MVSSDVTFYEMNSRIDLPEQMDVGALYFIKPEGVILVNHGDYVVEYGAGMGEGGAIEQIKALRVAHTTDCEAIWVAVNAIQLADVEKVREEMDAMKAQVAQFEEDTGADVSAVRAQIVVVDEELTSFETETTKDISGLDLAIKLLQTLISGVPGLVEALSESMAGLLERFPLGRIAAIEERQRFLRERLGVAVVDPPAGFRPPRDADLVIAGENGAVVEELGLRLAWADDLEASFTIACMTTGIRFARATVMADTDAAFTGGTLIFSTAQVRSGVNFTNTVGGYLVIGSMAVRFLYEAGSKTLTFTTGSYPLHQNYMQYPKLDDWESRITTLEAGGGTDALRADIDSRIGLRPIPDDLFISDTFATDGTYVALTVTATPQTVDGLTWKLNSDGSMTVTTVGQHGHARFAGLTEATNADGKTVDWEFSNTWTIPIATGATGFGLKITDGKRCRTMSTLTSSATATSRSVYYHTDAIAELPPYTDLEKRLLKAMAMPKQIVPDYAATPGNWVNGLNATLTVPADYRFWELWVESSNPINVQVTCGGKVIARWENMKVTRALFNVTPGDAMRIETSTGTGVTGNWRVVYYKVV